MNILRTLFFFLIAAPLNPAQAETLARARQSGTISLALRSLADASAVSSDDDMHKRDSVNIVRYGVSTTTTTRQ